MVKNAGNAPLSGDERSAISAAIERAEMKTAGEIFVVVAEKSGDYAWTTLVYGIVLALLVPIVMLVIGFSPLDIADIARRITTGGWSVGAGASAHDEAALGLMIIVALQSLTFILVSCIGLNSDVREALTPRFIKRQNVHRAALEQFLAHGIHQTEGRTGVLIFASLSEHQAEIIADGGIHAKVDPKVWVKAVATILTHAQAGQLSQGLIEAVNQSADILAEHFPPQEGDTNELSNKVVLI